MACGRLPILMFLSVQFVLGFAGALHADDAYYMLMFGSQRVPNDPNHAHTFATFVKASSGADPAGCALESQTISWLPATGIVRTLALRPECGRNFELHETLRWALNDDQRVSVWGPYQIEGELYYRAVNRLAELQSGQVRYKANDMGHRSDKVSNCIHAVSSITEGLRVRIGSPGWGETASFIVLGKLRPWIVNGAQLHPWVGTALGLDDYPLIYREPGQRPYSRRLFGSVFRLFGGERDLEATYGRPVCE
jgi:hypothetical protein